MTEISTPGAAESPSSKLDEVLGYVPRALASHMHVVLLMLLGFYLILLPLFGITVSSNAELIGGNYCNVTSDIGACIAAGGTLTALHHLRKRRKVEEATHKIMADLYLSHHGQHHPAAIAEIVAPQE